LLALLQPVEARLDRAEHALHAAGEGGQIPREFADAGGDGFKIGLGDGVLHQGGRLFEDGFDLPGGLGVPVVELAELLFHPCLGHPHRGGGGWRDRLGHEHPRLLTGGEQGEVIEALQGPGVRRILVGASEDGQGRHGKTQVASDGPNGPGQRVLL
jgi:hypothetical protein